MSVELLAPAGSPAALNAAVRAGADAVYLGLDNFNARHGADNFTLANLKEACDYCHLRGAKVYLTVNTIVITKEISELLDMVEGAYRAGVDAFIVQDVGIARTISDSYGSEFVHISTQMNIHNLAGVEAAHVLGAGRITLARELSIGEIREICNAAHALKMEVETFVHGAICVCYSGQCFMSSMIGGRSANRGMCAQACRLPYELLMGDDKRSVGRSAGEFLLSPKDMCNINHLQELASAGVDSFKIEGRMKSPEYVSSVVGVYRKTIDMCNQVTNDDMDKLASSFSRGFTDGYLSGRRDNSLMSYNRPNNRGVFVGRVKKIGGEFLEVTTEKPLSQGDKINIWNKRGGTIVELTNDCKFTTSKALIPYSKTFRDVKPKDRVFRIRAAGEAFEQDFREPRLCVSAKLRLKVGDKLECEVSSCDASHRVLGGVVENARTKAVNENDIIEHFDRLGKTDFVPDNIEVDLDDNVGIGFSQIHKIRTEALEGLKSVMLHKESREDRALIRIKREKLSDQRGSVKPKICLIATNPENARGALRSGVEVYVPATNFAKGTALYSGCASEVASQTTYPDGIKIILPVVNRGKQDFMRFRNAGEGVLCDDIASFLCAQSEGLSPELGQMVPITNSHGAHLLNKLGASTVWLSPELNLAQIKNMAEMLECEVGIYAFGRQRLMLTEHCELMSAGPCDEDCDHCRRRRVPSWLKDRKDYLFPTITDVAGRTTIYNSQDLDAMPYFEELMGAGVSRFMIDSTFMNKEEMLSIIARAKDSLITPPQKRLKNSTSGHLFRGV